MKQKSPQNNRKYFKYPLTKTMLGLAVAVLFLSVIGIGVSVYRLAEYGINSFTQALQSPLLIGVSLLCIVVVCSIFIKSQYFVDDTHYGSQFGFIISKFPLKDVTAVELNTDTNKLTVFVGESFSVLTLSPLWRDDFIAAMRAGNANIDFTFTLTDTAPDDKK